MKPNSIVEVQIGTESISEILIKVKNFLLRRKEKFFHLVNLNPDIFVLAYQNSKYRQIINKADSILIDGIGIQIAAKLFSRKYGERMTGTDMMRLLVGYAADNDKKVMFLGGKENTAELTGRVLKKVYPNLIYISDFGAVDIKEETVVEKRRVLNLIKKFSPDFLFVAYGPPYQEKWIYANRKQLCRIVCMGVGGAFKLISGKARRAPTFLVSLGFEWLWRFIVEPQRIITKMPRYIQFIKVILRHLTDEKIFSSV